MTEEISGSRDATARLWDVAAEQRIATFTRGTDSGVSSVALSPDGKVLAYAARRLSLWSVATGQQIATLRGELEGRRRVGGAL